MSPPRFSAVHDGALPIRWLHIPKAGSAFVNVVARFGCPSLVGTNRSFSIAADFVHWLNASQTSSRARRRCPRLSPPWAAHQPVLRAESRHASLVGVFRQPAQRLLSGFHHRENGMANAMIAPGMPMARRAAMRRAAAGNPTTYARWPGIAGCATKMLVGRACASERPPSAAEVASAVRVLHERFVFVGVLEVRKRTGDATHNTVDA